MNKTLHIYLSIIGKKGGSKTGPTKRRGNKEYYRLLAGRRKKMVPSLAADRDAFKARVVKMKGVK